MFLLLLCGIGIAPCRAALVNKASAALIGPADAISANPQEHLLGRFLWVSCHAAANVDVLSVNDLAGNNFVKIGTAASSGRTISAWYAADIRGGAANVVSCKFSSAVYNLAVVVLQFSDLSSAPLRAHSGPGQIGSGNIALAGPINAQAGDLLVSAYSGDAAVGITAGAGYFLEEVLGGGHAAVETQIAPSGGGFDGSFALGGASNWAAIMAAFVPASQPTIIFGPKRLPVLAVAANFSLGLMPVPPALCETTDANCLAFTNATVGWLCDPATCDQGMRLCGAGQCFEVWTNPPSAMRLTLLRRDKSSGQITAQAPFDFNLLVQ